MRDKLIPKFIPKYRPRTEIDIAMLESMAAALRAGVPFSFNNEDMADLLDRMRAKLLK